MYKIQYGGYSIEIHVQCTLLGTLRTNERYLYCRRIFKSNKKTHSQREREGEEAAATTKYASTVVVFGVVAVVVVDLFPIFASAACESSPLSL